MATFRNLLRRRAPEIHAAVRAGFAVEEHVAQLVDSLERKQAAGTRATDLSPFARCTHVDAVSVERMQGSHVLLERITKQVSFFPQPSSAVPLVLRSTFSLERASSHLFDLDDFVAHVMDERDGATILRVSDSAPPQTDRARIDALVDAWCAEHASGAAARRDALWFVSMVLSHPSDHLFDCISRDLGV
ncbi:hypothetical protein KFE25_012329 [Diacronema lutheri]|uniref:Uncharacterized protein n=1 Tax=Diacronema lutheri TaxID=2081491 RepID=A0A8J5XAI7_DIALT|nr:hypothetical protein KFE25_012329 [Diacronema lutheri]